MPPTLTAPDPTIFSTDVLAFAAARGVTEYLAPLYDLAKRCFDGVDVKVLHEYDAEIAGLQWICFEVAAAHWDLDRYRPASDAWHAGYLLLPPAVREAFVLGVS